MNYSTKDLPKGFSIVPGRGGKGFAFKPTAHSYPIEGPGDGSRFATVEAAIEGAVAYRLGTDPEEYEGRDMNYTYGYRRTPGGMLITGEIKTTTFMRVVDTIRQVCPDGFEIDFIIRVL